MPFAGSAAGTHAPRPVVPGGTGTVQHAPAPAAAQPHAPAPPAAPAAAPPAAPPASEAPKT
jgi:hypothetical protein